MRPSARRPSAPCRRLLFVELGGKGDKFHVGYWFTVYDEAQAKALETPAKRAFRRIHESLPK